METHTRLRKEVWILKIKLDRLLAILSIIAGLCLILIFSFGAVHAASKYVFYGVAMVSASTIYLLLRKRMRRLELPQTSLTHTSTLYVLVFFSFVLLSYSTITLFFEAPNRPPSYFASLTAMSALIVAQIFLDSEKKIQKLILLQILLIALTLRSGIFFSYPSMLGIDPFFHVNFADSILKNGHVIPIISQVEPAGYSSYFNFPVFHLIVAEMSQVTSLDLKISTWASVGLFEVISIICVYSIAKSLMDSKVGLIAALLVGTANWSIQWGYWIIPMTLELAMMPLFIWIILTRKTNTSWISVFVLFWILVTMTHTMSSFVLLIIVASFLISDRFLEIISHHRGNTSSIITILSFLFCLIFLLFYWTDASNFISYVGNSFSSLFASSVKRQLWTGAEPIWPKDIVLYFFSFIGTLLLLSNRFLEKNRLRLVVGGCIITLIALLSNALGLSSIVPERWAAFSQVLLSILAAVGFVSIASLLKNRKKVLILFAAAILSLLLVFPMITSFEADFDNPFLGHDEKYRFALLNSEINGADTLARFCNKSIKTDSFFYLYFTYNLNKSTDEISLNDIKESFSDSTGVVVFRQYCLQQSMWFSTPNETGLAKIGFSVQYQLDANPRFNRIFSSNVVTSYYSGQKP